MTDLIFLDTETTGLEPEKHEVWEIAWAVNDGPVEERVLVHSLKTADPTALALNGYLRKGPDGVRSLGPIIDIEIRQIFAGNTIVCANPTFDRMFLRARWGYEPWHYRSIDVESMAMVVFGWERPRGLADIIRELTARGYAVTQPDHSATRDVEAVRDAYTCLRIEVDKYKIY